MANYSLLTPKERARLILNTIFASNVEKLVSGYSNYHESSSSERRRLTETTEREERHIGSTTDNSATSTSDTASKIGNDSRWKNPLDFYVSMLNYSLGVGTIVGFPRLCYKHGGGIFVVPYLIMLFLEGIPLVCMEIVIGQRFRSKYIIRTWGRVHSSTIGLGMSAVFVSFITLVYFNIIVAWCIRYFVNSFQNPLPWSSCSPGVKECSNSSRPSEYYWYRMTLDASNDINSVTDINWNLYLYVVIAWLIVWLYNIKGVKAAVKPGYILLGVGAVLYVALFMLVVHLDGWARGLAIFFNTGQIDKLLTIEIWRDAATHVFFSLGIGFGSISVYASYNNVEFKCKTAALYYGLIDTVVGICSCIIVFSFFGFEVYTEEKKCQDRLLQSNISLVNSTTCQADLSQPALPDPFSLAFITWSDSFTHIRYPNLWSSFGYFFLFLSGFSSMSGMVLLVALFIREITALKQEFASGLVCLVSCILGLVFVTNSGLYLVNLFNNYAGCPLQWVALIEVISVVCVMGRENFCSMIEDMTGEHTNIYWKLCWFVISPAILLTLIALSLFDITKIEKGYLYSTWEPFKGMQEVYYPTWCYIIMATLCLVPLLLILSVFLIYAYKSRHFLFQKCHNSWKGLWYWCCKAEEFELQEFSELQHRYERRVQISMDRIDENFPELLSFDNIVHQPMKNGGIDSGNFYGNASHRNIASRHSSI